MDARTKGALAVLVLVLVLLVLLACDSGGGVNYDHNLNCGPANWSACEGGQ